MRLNGAPLLAVWAQERSLRQSPAQASAHLSRARATLADQHAKMRAVIESILHQPLQRGVAAAAGASVAYEEFYDALNAIALHGVEASQLGALAAHPDVAIIEPIQMVTASLVESIPLMNADDVWAHPDANGAPLDGTGIRIGIIDTGVDYTHPDLGGCLGAGCKVAGGYDFVNGDADPMDDNGHGTHVSATAAGSGSYPAATGPAPIRGVAPNARIYAYKVLDASGSGSSTAIISAIERCADPDQDGNYADHLDVCSMSLGGAGTPDDAMSVAVDNATASGVVFTVAAGNSGPAAQTILSPGTSRRAITVAAACKPSAVGVNSQCPQAIASFSSRGPVVWTANGVTQTLAKPDVAAYGVSICAAEWGTYQSGSRCLDSRHVALSGTSMATPHVAGLAALLRQAHPEWAPDQVKSLVANGAVSLGLDPTIQGAGAVDALNSLTLAGFPAAVARLGGLPLSDQSVPTSRFGTFSSDLAVTNTTSSDLTYVPSVANADAGLSISFSTAALTIAAGQTGALTVTRQVDHDIVPSGAEVHGTVVLSTPLGDARATVQVAVQNRLQAAPSAMDLGVDLASLPAWTGRQVITLTNSRTDTAGTYTASVSCCRSASQASPAGISATLDQTTVVLSPGGTATLGLTVNVNNAGLLNARFDGAVTLTSPLQSMTIPVTFFKGYGLSFDFAGQTPSSVALSSATAPPRFYQPASASLMLYLTDPGPYFAEAAWPDFRHVLKADIATDVAVQNVTLDKATATHLLDLRPIDRSGGPASIGAFRTRFAHVASGGGIDVGINTTNLQLWFSDLPAAFVFTASFVGRSATGDLNAFTYEVPGPVASDVLLTNGPADLIARDVQVARGTATGVAYLLPWSCLVWPYYSTVNGMSGGGATCSSSTSLATAAPLTSPLHVNFYSNIARDLLAPGYPYAPSVQFEIDADQNLSSLYRGPQMLVNASHAYSWNTLMPWPRSIEVTQATSTFACDEWPASTLVPFASGPMVDGWAFHNYGTVVKLRGAKGLGLMAFGFDGCVQDAYANTADTNYQLYKDGVLAGSGPISSTAERSWQESPGQYRFELRRSAVFGGVTTQVESISTFAISTGPAQDQNPPALQSLHLLAHGTWQEVLDPDLINRVSFRVSPMPGYSAPNTGAPEYLLMPDSLSSVSLEYSADGIAWTPIDVTGTPSGEYSSGPLIVDPGVALHWLRISATDVAGNSLRHTFQVPRGRARGPSGADLTAPTVSITQPVDGKRVSGTVSVAASATDNVGVTRVQLWIDGALFGEQTAPPFAWDWNTASVADGTHQLRARAFDAEENLADSAVISVAVGPDTIPPTVALTAPAPGTMVVSGVEVAADAQDDASVAGVEFFADGISIGTSTVAPFAMWWDTSVALDGDHWLTAVATDSSGNSSTSASVRVTVDHTPPAVDLTDPAGGALVHGVVTVSAAASDAVGISRVEFLCDGIAFASTTAAPYTATWASGPDGAHVLSARAIDLAGNSSSSLPVNVTVDNSGPSVALTAPAAGAKVRGITTLSADASDVSGVARVEFLVDGLVAGVSSQPPWSYDWSSGPDGAHTLSARAYDVLGNASVSASRSITVDNTPPATSVTAPAAGSRVRGSVTLTASASDAYGVALVEFFVDGVLVASDSTAPFSVVWLSTSAGDGVHTISTRATDVAGNAGTSPAVSFTVDNTAPFVTVTAPVANATVSGTVVVSADASDASGITRVEFRAGSTLIASDSTAPYSANWDSTQVPNGSYNLTATAFDAAGNSLASAPVTVTVSNVSNAAVYDATLRAPKCSTVAARCWSGTLLTGRGPVGPEANAPNTINGSCADGTSGTFHSDESLDALEITSATGSFAPGMTVTIKATVWAWSTGASDALDLYSAGDANAPVWTPIATLVPPGGGAQTLTASYTLPNAASLQAIRGRFRYGGTAAPCGTGAYDDHDDLVFAVGGIAPDTTPPTTAITSPASGATLSGVATLSASATDNRAVAKVEFYAGAVLIGTKSTSPYSVSWNTSTVANGTYVLTSKAYDSAGNTATSAGVSVTVNNVSTDLLVNGGFEGTSTPWVLSGTVTYSPTAGPAHGGTGHVYLGGSVNSSGSVYQQITIPAGTAPSLTFWLYVTTQEATTTTTPYDQLSVEVLSSGGTLLATLATYSNVNWGNGYVQRGPFSLAGWAGQTVRVQFRQSNDVVYATTFRIDDASVK